MTARTDYPHTAFFADGASGHDPILIDRRREAGRALDEIDHLRAIAVAAVESTDDDGGAPFVHRVMIELRLINAVREWQAFCRLRPIEGEQPQ